MFARKSRWSALAALAIAAACTDVVPTAPTLRPVRPSFNVSADPSPTVKEACNTALISIPGVGAASVFPSLIEMTGAATSGFKVTVTIKELTHSFTRDIDMLLVSPNGTKVMLMSDVGGDGNDFRGTTLTFDDDASSFLTPHPAQVIPSGSYKPTYIGGNDAIPGGVPAEPYQALLSAIAGDPNGTWRLYVWDDAPGDAGNIVGGWCVTITSPNAPPAADAGGPYTADEGSSITFDGTASSDPNDDIVSYAWDFGDGSTGSGSKPEHTYADNGTYKVTLVVTDDDGVASKATTTATVNNVAPQVTAIGLPAGPVAVGVPITLSATFTDAGTADTHTASFDLDNGETAAGSVIETNGSGSATATVTYTQAGVYTIHATVTDNDGDTGSRSSASDVPAYVVVYDPSAGFVTGGGWIESPEGAYVADPSLTGQATFGFVARYQTGASTPIGNTEFQFHARTLNFSSTSYHWLVVAGNKAKYKGVGKINGQGEYGFMLTAVDDGTVEGIADAFRIKIWNLADGTLVYDNQRGASEDSNASTAIGGGSIVIHKY